MRFAGFLIVVCLAGFCAGCGEEEDGGGGGGYEDPAYTPEPEASVPTAEPTEETVTAAEQFFTSVEESPASASPTGIVTGDPELDALVEELKETVRTNSGIADELTGLGYQVTPADVAGFYDLACANGVDGSMAQIRAELPGADLSALPALNRFVTSLATGCASGDPAFVDAFSHSLFAFLAANTHTVAPAPAPEPTPLMNAIYKGGCSAIKKGLSTAIKRLARVRGPAYGLSMAISSAMTTCPEELDARFGDELRELIASLG